MRANSFNTLAKSKQNCYNDIQLKVRFFERGTITEAIYEGNFKEMPTIIERIAAAEADAEALRRNALEAARSAETAAEEDAAASLKIAREEAKAGLALAASMAEREAEAETERLLRKSGEEAEKLIAAAETRLPKAIEAVVNRILSDI